MNSNISLPLVEDFYTLQGEGAHAGRAAYFVRLGGCNAGCKWCDSKESWNPNAHPSVPFAEIVRRAAGHPAKTVVITGGEPLLHPLDGLCEGLHEAGLTVHLETSGSHPFSGSFDWVCLSPKRHRPPLDEAWARANEVKVVIETPEDLLWAEECAAKATKATKAQLYLQPEWSRREEITPLVVEYIKANPRWRLSLQSHKYISIA